MAAQTDRLLARAQERFAVQDYYGAVHLLEEIVAGGRSFADVHHLLGVSLSLLGQSERALKEFARALELNPRYLEALIHQGVVLNELGREREADEAFRRAAASVAPASTGLPAHVAARLANLHSELADRLRRGRRRGPGDRAVPSRARIGPFLPGSALSARAAPARVRARARGPRGAGGRCSRRVRTSWMPRRRSGWRTIWRETPIGARAVWRRCLDRRPENVRVEAYLAMLGRTEA